MKVLTIKQPWATLVIEGYKEYEFRSWKTNYRGKILIHSSMSTNKEQEKRFKNYNLNYVRGAIIGEAILVDCILVTDDLKKQLRTKNSIVYDNSGYNEKYAWKLENVIKYEKPIYVKGKLGLWTYEL